MSGTSFFVYEFINNRINRWLEDVYHHTLGCALTSLAIGATKKQIEYLSYYSTSTIISISTAMLLGREFMPTADLACFPFSPNTATIRSENPLITLG